MVPTRQLRIFSLALVQLGVSLSFALPAAAQGTRTTMLDYATGSEFEDYLRVLQVAGLTTPYPWSIRGFSPREVSLLASADSGGPWRLAERIKLGGLSVGPIAVRVLVNSSYPYGSNDGPVWAGRGLTTSVVGGISGRGGAFSFTLAPHAFRAENAGFELPLNAGPGHPLGQPGAAAGAIDLPQRFGEKPYGRLDPGASTIRFDSKAVTIGISTANGWIGPATEYPFLLSTNAGGFPHIFAGTGQPLDLWLARIHTRVVWGKTQQSDYSPVSGSSRYTSRSESGTERLATHASVVVMPRGVPGLELGVARFIHVPYRVGDPGRSFWTKPFKTIFLRSEYAQGDTLGADNQLATAFFRWVFPRAGFELFAERGYEDHFYDRRDLLQRPEHEREYSLGFQKILRNRPGALDVLKAELMNAQFPASIYVHGQLRQGHTQRGQILGSSAGFQAGAASIVSWTSYAPSSRTSVALRRIVRGQQGNFGNTGVVTGRSPDVIVAAAVERTRMRRAVDYGARVEVMQNFNRDFKRDVPNLNLQLTVRLKPW